MKLCSGKCRSKARLDGKTAVVTGCNTGIGKETVLDFVKRGARVVMACRDLKRAEDAANEIRKATEGLEGVGEVVVTKLDLSSLTSVRQCAQHLLTTEPRINLLINNAGVMGCANGKTEDGFETHFGINHLGHFLFTCLLLPRIRSSAPARIVTVSSLLHKNGHIDFDDLNWDNSYSTNGAYARSKLANVLFSAELGRRLEGTEVTTYSLHPGVIATELSRNFDNGYFKGATRIYKAVVHVFLKSPEMGAQTTINCAVEESLSNETGLYYSDCEKETPVREARDPEVAQKLWTESARLVGLGDWDPFTAPDNVQVQ